AGPPDGRPARSVAIRYRYADEDVLGDAGAIHAGLAVPLQGEAEQLGWITVFTRSGARDFGDPELLELETLAMRAGPAIENARRFREARQLADLDSLTGLHNRRYFHEVLARECNRAHRYAGRLELPAGIAELRGGDDGATIFQRADEALYRAKEAGKGTVVAATA